MEQEKLGAIAVSLEGEALVCLQWTKTQSPFQIWQQFQQQLLLRFRSTREGNLCERFLAIKQVGSVAKFQREFESLAAPLRRVSDDVLEITFVNRLTLDVRAKLRLLGPRRLGPIMETAQKIEDRNPIIRSLQEPTTLKAVKPNSMMSRLETNRFETFPTKTVTVGEWPAITKREVLVRCLTDVEWQRKKEKGLCFRYDEKFTVGHQCRHRELRVLLVQDDDGDDDSGVD